MLDREGRDWVRARLHCTVYDARVRKSESVFLGGGSDGSLRGDSLLKAPREWTGVGWGPLCSQRCGC